MISSTARISSRGMAPRGIAPMSALSSSASGRNSAMSIPPSSTSTTTPRSAIAGSPPVPSAQLEIERDKLDQQGVLARLAQTCEGELPFGVRYATPSGDDEIVTSVTPMRTPSGCWAVITSFSSAALPGSNLGVPYYATTEVKVAAVVYL